MIATNLNPNDVEGEGKVSTIDPSASFYDDEEISSLLL
jgi:hypothetical protein